MNRIVLFVKVPGTEGTKKNPIKWTAVQIVKSEVNQDKCQVGENKAAGILQGLIQTMRVCESRDPGQVVPFFIWSSLFLFLRRNSLFTFVQFV